MDSELYDLQLLYEAINIADNLLHTLPPDDLDWLKNNIDNDQELKNGISQSDMNPALKQVLQQLISNPTVKSTIKATLDSTAPQQAPNTTSTSNTQNADNSKLVPKPEILNAMQKGGKSGGGTRIALTGGSKQLNI
jgi:hypothetical protein